MGLHDPIDAFVIGRWEPLGPGRAPQDSPDPAIAIGWRLTNHRFDLGNQIGVGLRWPSKRLGDGRFDRTAMFERAKSSASQTVFIANRPWATTATATGVFLSPRRLQEPP